MTRRAERLLVNLLAEAAEHPQACPHRLSPMNLLLAQAELEELGLVEVVDDELYLGTSAHHYAHLLPATV